MPIKIPSGLPAAEVLQSENIFVMDELRATAQDIRPLRIAILNLMPTKITTENQIIRLLSNSPLQIELTLLRVIEPEEFEGKKTVDISEEIFQMMAQDLGPDRVAASNE